MAVQARLPEAACSVHVTPESFEVNTAPPVTVAANLVPSAELVIEVQARLPEPACGVHVAPELLEVNTAPFLAVAANLVPSAELVIEVQSKEPPLIPLLLQV